MLRAVEGIQNRVDSLNLFIDTFGHIGKLGQGVLCVLYAGLNGRLRLIDLFQVAVSPVCSLIGQGFGAALGVIRIIGNLIHPIGNTRPGIIHMIKGRVHQVSQLIDFSAQFLNLICVKAQGQVRRHLSGDAAHVLTAFYVTVVPVTA